MIGIANNFEVKKLDYEIDAGKNDRKKRAYLYGIIDGKYYSKDISKEVYVSDSNRKSYYSIAYLVYLDELKRRRLNPERVGCDNDTFCEFINGIEKPKGIWKNPNADAAKKESRNRGIGLMYIKESTVHRHMKH